MYEFEGILKNIGRFIDLTEEERQYFTSILKTTKIRKKQYVAQPEFVCRYKNYIINGAMRSYLVDNDGQEHTIQFAIDDWWISDFNSYIYQTPATLFVEALEETTVLQLEYHAEEKLLELYPKFEKFFRIFHQRALASLQKRVLSNLSMSAEKRYDEFLAKYPAIAERVPQYALASFLGMTTEFLSKIRSDKRKAQAQTAGRNKS